jgi:hypothetical protein
MKHDNWQRWLIAMLALLAAVLVTLSFFLWR